MRTSSTRLVVTECWLVTALSVIGCGGRATAAGSDAASDDTGAEAAPANMPDAGSMDATADTTDSGAPPTDAPVDLSDEDAVDAVEGGDGGPAAECVRGETRPCDASQFTGCPGSSQVCQWVGTWSPCICRQCTLPLDAGACSWTLEGEFVLIPFPGNTGGTIVSRISLDLQSSELPWAASESDCPADGGWYSLAAPNPSGPPTTLTIQLCPASCSEHLETPEIGFELQRNLCLNSG
jgi:hypothetical protein